ncbi:MAG TPA: hypothetical protein VEX36_05535 [Thermoleophilaceae bacterium]|nr:hypothetical protein [Thermoleophilaceae bacterium]
MSRVLGLFGWLGPTAPARDLPFVDAAAAVTALFLAYGARAAASSHYPFEWAAIAPFVRIALPVSLAAVLLCTAALGLYGDRAVAAGWRTHVAAAAYAVAVAAAIGTYWGGLSPPTLPLLLTAAACLGVLQYGGRRLYWQVVQRRET